jgi:hypothetical protein
MEVCGCREEGSWAWTSTWKSVMEESDTYIAYSIQFDFTLWR